MRRVRNPDDHDVQNDQPQGKRTKGVVRLHHVSDDTANISPEILTHINAWLTSLKQQNYSSYTCLAYRSAVCRFGEFVSLDKDLAGDWQAVNKKKLAYFLSTRLELG